MSERERLTDLILNAPKLEFPFGSRAQGKTYQTAHNLADHLLANGVIVPPCKVGQTIFLPYWDCDGESEEKLGINEGEVVSFSLQKEGLWAYCRYKCGLTFWHIVETDFGKTVFLTKEEAEKALKEREGKE